MKEGPMKSLDYVEEVRKSTQEYIERLVEESQKMRSLIHSLESERCELEKQLIVTQAELDCMKVQRENLRKQFDAIESEYGTYCEKYVRVEQANDNLAQLYVATYRLHGTLDRGELLGAIKEIVVNLIGSEEMALFELSADGRTLELTDSEGVDGEALQVIPVGVGAIGGVAASGEIFLTREGRSAELDSDQANLTVCVPLKLDGRITGALAIFRLLEQKPELEPVDLEILDLLANQAAMALYCTKLHSEFGVRPGELA